MEKIEVTSISSRGQVVIPQGIRKRLHLNEGEKFVVLGEDDTIVLKKLEVPSFEGFDKLIKKTREFAEKKRSEEARCGRSKMWKKQDVEEAIKSVRGK